MQCCTWYAFLKNIHTHIRADPESKMWSEHDKEKTHLVSLPPSEQAKQKNVDKFWQGNKIQGWVFYENESFYYWPQGFIKMS